MKKIFITGVSSGLGKALVKTLVQQKIEVWGVARRKELLQNLHRETGGRFQFSIADISKKNAWDLILSQMENKNFSPSAVIFNAATSGNDLNLGIDAKSTQKIMQTNFDAVLKGVQVLLAKRKKIHFIAISSSSALKGNCQEGIGYPASKAALSIAFESLYQKYIGSGVIFTTIYFGPINTGMRRLKRMPPFTLSEDQAVNCVLKAIDEQKPFYHFPYLPLKFLRLMRAVLPNEMTLKIFSLIDNKYNN